MGYLLFWFLAYYLNVNWINKFKNFSGGGSYSENDSIKIGRWIELSDDYGEKSNVTYEGEYNNN